jgi:hypothetical protein
MKACNAGIPLLFKRSNCKVLHVSIGPTRGGALGGAHVSIGPKRGGALGGAHVSIGPKRGGALGGAYVSKSPNPRKRVGKPTLPHPNQRTVAPPMTWAATGVSHFIAGGVCTLLPERWSLVDVLHRCSGPWALGAARTVNAAIGVSDTPWENSLGCRRAPHGHAPLSRVFASGGVAGWLAPRGEW